MRKVRWPKQRQKLPFSRAVIWILLSTLLISGSAGLGLLYYQQIHELRTRDPQYTITSIVQTGPASNQLETAFLAKMMGLQASRNENLYQFNAQQAKEKLLSHPVMKRADVKKISPGVILVDYTIRKPIALLGDFSNTLIDEEGVPFPHHPFYSNEKLPLLILGMREMQWGEPIEGKKWKVALQLYRELKGHSELSKAALSRIDVSKIFARSYGQRQLIVGLGSHLLRLSSKNYREELANYSRLLPSLKEDEEFVIDLRMPQLGFIQKI